MADGRNNYGNPYYYYGGYGNYPQYELGSGIDMLGGNAVAQGNQNLLNSLIAVQEKKNLEEKARQEKFNQLLDVSLKDVKTKWRNEAVNLRDKWVNEVRDMAKQSQGRFDAKQSEKILAGRNKLNEFAGMSQEVSDWYKDAWKQALQIKNPEAQKKTLENITKIMNSPTLQDAYEKSSDPSWYVSGVQRYDWKKDVFPTISSATDKKGNLDKTKVEKDVIAGLERGDQALSGYYNQLKEDFPDLTPEKYAKLNAHWAWLNSNMAKETKGSGSDKEIKPIKPNSEGVWLLGHIDSGTKGKGIVIGSVKGKDGHIYSGATINSVFKGQDKNGLPEYEAVIRHDKFKTDDVEKQKEAFKNAFGKDMYDIWEAMGKFDDPAQQRSMVEKGEVVVPYSVIAPVLDNLGIKLEGMEDFANPQGTEDDPEGILDIANRISNGK